MKYLLLVVLAVALQTQPLPFGVSAAVEEAAKAEGEALNKALAEAASSSVDLIRSLEAHLKKYPGSSQRVELVRLLAKGAIDLKDDVRTVKYGEELLAAAPDDVLMLDRVSNSLLALGGKERAERALKYSRKFEEIIDSLPFVTGKDAPQKEEDRNRAESRALMFQAQARIMLGGKEDAELVAAQAFSAYPNAESARMWADVLLLLKRDHDAIVHLADAFAIPDMRAQPAERQRDRQRLGDLWVKETGSTQGLGDFLLSAYDETSRRVEQRRAKIMALDPNGAAQSVLDFTISALDGKKLQLNTLQGKVVVLDFWATWCEPCRTQHPMYEEVKKAYASRGDVVFLNLSADEDRDVVPGFLLEQKWDRNVYFEDGIARLLQITGIPTTVLLNKRGKVSSRMNGFLPDSFVATLKERIDEALAEK